MTLLSPLINVLLSESQKVLPAANKNTYRDPQPDVMQIMRDHRSLSHKWNVSIKALPSGFGELHRRGCRKRVGARGDDEHQGNKGL